MVDVVPPETPIMVTPKKKYRSWSQIRKELSKLDKDGLVALVYDLYLMNEVNTRFLHARFTREEATLDRYKKIIAKAMYPDVMSEEGEEVEFEAAQQAIRDFTLATSDHLGSLDLMIHLVESGSKYTLDCGDINEAFYDFLLTFYDESVQCVKNLPSAVGQPFKERLHGILASVGHFGWGFGDGLREAYHGAWPEEED
jgi:hypothetical protein